MKKFRFGAALVPALVLFCGAASATEITEQSLNKLMSISGMNKQLSSIPAMVEAGIEQAQEQTKARAKATKSAPAISDADFKGLKSAMVEAFEAKAIIQAAKEEIRRGVSEEDAKEVIAWLESDLGRKLTKAEEAASTPAAVQAMAKSAQALMADEKRLAFAQKLDAILGATDMAMNFRESTALAIFVAMSSAMHPDSQPDVAGFKARLEPALNEGRPNVEQFTQLAFVYSYRNIDLESLEKYRHYLETPAAKHFNDSGRKGMAAALDRSIEKVAKAIAATAKKQKAG